MGGSVERVGPGVAELFFAVDVAHLFAGQRVEDFDAAVVEDRQLAEGAEVDLVGEGLVLGAGERGGGGWGRGRGGAVRLAGGVVVARVRVVGGAAVGVDAGAGQGGVEVGGRVGAVVRLGLGVAGGAAVLGVRRGAGGQQGEQEQEAGEVHGGVGLFGWSRCEVSGRCPDHGRDVRATV